MLTLLLLACAPDAPPVAVCNGVPGLCDVGFADVTLPAAHNAMSNTDEGWIAANQQHPPREQLAAGVRGLLLDVYDVDGELTLCHGPCFLGSAPLADVLGDLATFLDAHPDDLVALIVQDDVPPDALRAGLVAADLGDRLVTPPADGVWPTLGELLADGRQLLATRESGGAGPPDVPPFYDIGWDTPYSFATPDDFTCDPLRGDPSHALFLINHWISDPLPNRAAAADVNTAAALRARLDDCARRWQRGPTLLAVDHVDVGDLIAVVHDLNAAATR